MTWALGLCALIVAICLLKLAAVIVTPPPVVYVRAVQVPPLPTTFDEFMRSPWPLAVDHDLGHGREVTVYNHAGAIHRLNNSKFSALLVPDARKTPARLSRSADLPALGHTEPSASRGR